MKTLKFKENLIPKILDGSKKVTWRIFDDKDLSFGDILSFLNSETGEAFANVEIIGVQEKKIGELTQEDLKLNNYKDIPQVIDSHKVYYGDNLSVDTPIKIVFFKIGKRQKARGKRQRGQFLSYLVKD